MADQDESIKRQQLIQRAVLLALGGVATSTAVAIPTEGDAQSPIHPDVMPAGGGRALTISRKKVKKQAMPCPPFASYPVDYIFVETWDPNTLNGAPAFDIPVGLKAFAYYQFALQPGETGFSVSDRWSGNEALQIPGTGLGSAKSLTIVFCTDVGNKELDPPAWCTATAPLVKKPKP
jgi:hypothetical protein